jgi:hypothetical protein
MTCSIKGINVVGKQAPPVCNAACKFISPHKNAEKDTREKDVL